MTVYAAIIVNRDHENQFVGVGATKEAAKRLCEAELKIVLFFDEDAESCGLNDATGDCVAFAVKSEVQD
jgi:hypothetical protein